MSRKIVFFLFFFLVSCVENLVHIAIFDNGSFSAKYTSIGHKNDLLDSDFTHPKSDDKYIWLTSLSKKSENLGDDVWEKEKAELNAEIQRLRSSDGEAHHAS